MAASSKYLSMKRFTLGPKKKMQVATVKKRAERPSTDARISTGKETWKARALERGLDRARIWVGDHGRWKQLVGSNQAFRQAPSFEARAERRKDDTLLDRLLAIYETKYPDEIAKWRDRMRNGHADGSRILIRYTPV